MRQFNDSVWDTVIPQSVERSHIAEVGSGSESAILVRRNGFRTTSVTDSNNNGVWFHELQEKTTDKIRIVKQKT